MNTEHIHVVEPLYVKTIDVSYVIGDTGVQLCQAADRIQENSAVGAQKVRGLWHLFLSSEEARTIILNDSIVVQKQVVPIHSTHPYERSNEIGFATEKIVFKDIPLSDDMGNDLIEQYLRDHPQIQVRSNIFYSRIRVNNRNTNYRSGDRYVFVEANFSPPLPENTQIGHYNVRVWHRSQEMFCKRCNMNTHRTMETTECDNYRADRGTIIAFKEDWDILSNYFMCKISVYGHTFRSAEQAYQWRKCRDCLRDDLAAQILRAPTPHKAKQIAYRLDEKAIKQWHEASGHIVVMAEVLTAKAQSNIDFRTTLLRTGITTIVEATKCTTWGCGLPPHLAVTVNTFPGKNLCGQLLMELRSRLMKEDRPCHNSSPRHMNQPHQTSPSGVQHNIHTSVTSPTSPSENIHNISSSPSSNDTTPPQCEPPQQEVTREDDVIRKDEPTNTPSTPPTHAKLRDRVLPQSPLIGKLLYRRQLKPRRIIRTHYNSDGDYDTDNDKTSDNDYAGWPNWDKDSIASEIVCVEDCDLII